MIKDRYPLRRNHGALSLWKDHHETEDRTKSVQKKPIHRSELALQSLARGLVASKSDVSHLMSEVLTCTAIDYPGPRPVHTSQSRQMVPQILGSPRGGLKRSEPTAHARDYTNATRQADPLRKLNGDEIGASSYRSPSGSYFNREATAEEREAAVSNHGRDSALSDWEKGRPHRPFQSWAQLAAESREEADE